MHLLRGRLSLTLMKLSLAGALHFFSNVRALNVFSDGYYGAVL